MVQKNSKWNLTKERGEEIKEDRNLEGEARKEEMKKKNLNSTLDKKICK